MSGRASTPPSSHLRHHERRRGAGHSHSDHTFNFANAMLRSVPFHLTSITAPEAKFGGGVSMESLSRRFDTIPQPELCPPIQV
jgi:hypothetical protein